MREGTITTRSEIQPRTKEEEKLVGGGDGRADYGRFGKKKKKKPKSRSEYL